MNERETIDRGWYYVFEPDDGAHAPPGAIVRAGDGRALSRRLHGVPGRIDVADASGAALPAATLLRAAAAVGAALESRHLHGHEVRVQLGPAGTAPAWRRDPDHVLRLDLDGAATAAAPTAHGCNAAVEALLAEALAASGRPGVRPPRPDGLPARATSRAMFFESLMNTDMPHNDREISQGVLHMISPLPALGVEVVLVNAKMPIVGDHRPVLGLENLVAAVQGGPIAFVGITLLEGYWEGVVRLIRTLRELGCRARIAVGGVMPTLAPEHVAAHLPDVSFICRGAGEHFVPALCRILGDTDVDTPLSDAQVQALLALDGVIALDRLPGGLRLLSCTSSRTVSVESLDRVALDLSFVQARHIEGGIELSTSRGCIHKCSFCSILGRESYQARSAGGILDVLAGYERRFHELHPGGVPGAAYRVHFSDDDFACDKARAAALFRAILQTQFRLSSVQVAIGDLCRKENGKLLAEPEPDLLDAMKPECFADHGRDIPKVDFYEDHRSRDWSSFLQIGVETYSDTEIARLGKGYKRVHVRTIVAELARRGLHMDGYFILSNCETTLDDLVEVFSEVARLKLRFPEHFHMRFPVVPHLVSYFTSASHRRHVRQGRAHVMKLRGHAQVPNHPELDYPFVDYDVPLDEAVDRTVQTGFVTDERFYTANVEVLRELWSHWLLRGPEADRPRLQRLVRRLDDLPRRLVFDMLRHAWLGEDDGWPGATLDRDASLSHAEAVLGPHDAWFKLFRHTVKAAKARRLVAWVTSLADVHRALDVLRTSDAPHLVLHLRGPGVIAGLADLDPGDVTLHVDATLLDSEPRNGAERVWCGVPASADGTAVVRLHPDHLADLPRQLRAAAAAGTVRLEVAPRPWSADATRALAKALFAAADPLRAVVVLDADAPGPRSGLEPELALDRDGAFGRADAFDADGRLTARFAPFDALTNPDRHFIDLADPARLPGLPSLDALAKAAQPAERVVRSFLTWLRPPAEGAAASA